MQEQAGAKLITVHCRTRSQKITGNADWTYIPKIKENITVPLILNGDISTPQTVLQAFHTVGADGIMIGRAAIGNPFLFRMAKDIINTGNYSEPTIKEKIDCCLKHLSYNIEYKNNIGLKEFRKHYHGYLRGMYDAFSFRKRLVVSEDFSEIESIL